MQREGGGGGGGEGSRALHFTQKINKIKNIAQSLPPWSLFKIHQFSNNGRKLSTARIVLRFHASVAEQIVENLKKTSKSKIISH